MNRRPLISYPTAAKSTDRDEEVSRPTCSLTLLVRSVSTAKFSFDSKIQFRQLSSVSTVKFRDERLMYFTSSTLWLCILRHVLEMLLEFHSG